MCLSDLVRDSQAVNGHLTQSYHLMEGKPEAQGEKRPVEHLTAQSGLESRPVGSPSLHIDLGSKPSPAIPLAM